MEHLTPRKVVEELDKHIIGQDEAKKAVAIALRNRLRRMLTHEDMKDEITPKNILMIGPTGVGKTEIARRLAALVKAPFVKVEATKFTEVGYVGRDVDSIIRELVETSIRMVRAEKTELVRAKAEKHAEERLIDILAPLPRKERSQANPLAALFGMQQKQELANPEDQEEAKRKAEGKREQIVSLLAEGQLEDQVIELDVQDNRQRPIGLMGAGEPGEMMVDMSSILGDMLGKKTVRKKMSVKEARRYLIEEEADKLVDAYEIETEAIRNAEENGIVFIDEFDKIAGRNGTMGPDVSREGVQRDILPIVEGSTVQTKYGPVRTKHMLFIAAGAFHVSKPSDLIPELQGRFPIRVELQTLSEEEFRRILTEPKGSLVKQYKALLEADGVDLVIDEGAIEEIAATAYKINSLGENIGARRLHTVMEKLLEDISFEAPEKAGKVVIDREFVRRAFEKINMDAQRVTMIL
ncbi:MAG TPA: ATP-dependent protease ATPase subunit HslU [Bacillota bacterium]|nr:ATP-dependent protease ATPase subunit HslU [Bacillota bacterium]HOH10303.1 ATP-dependent protease ATPase subunit HslU [Bacillota bacterium]HOS50676.1 ATP-dependent protease ATPase subunit HslU [Bacillota bacterium]HPI01690.1 ATP-dependent protease ATPase subunit HslU [Bacillota bacterium]HPM63882.1 ATP-dependent protease ATPase subunit HslU [Bacillota bacterium]